MFPPTLLNPQVIQFLETFYGKEYLQNILKKLSYPPLSTTVRVNTLKSNIDNAFRLIEQKFEQNNKKFEMMKLNNDTISIKHKGPFEYEKYHKRFNIFFT